MGIISWIIFGLIAGALGKLLMPGDDPGGLLVTTGLGVAGAFVGGFVATQLGLGSVDGFNLGSLAIAAAGAFALLFGYRQVKGRS